MTMKRDNRNLVIVEGPPRMATTMSIQAAALDLAFADDPLEHLTIARPTLLILADSSVQEVTDEAGVHLLFEDQRNSG